MGSNEPIPGSSNTPNRNETNSDDLQEIYRNPRAVPDDGEIVLNRDAVYLANEPNQSDQPRVNYSLSNTVVRRNQSDQEVLASSVQRAPGVPISASRDTHSLNDNNINDNGNMNDGNQPSTSKS